MVQIEIIPESIQLIKITDAIYFSSKYQDYISNSKLSLINPDEGGSYEKYKLGLNSENSPIYFELGSAVHSMLLQKNAYIISSICKPTGKLGNFAEELFKMRSEGHTIQDSINIASKNADYFYQKLSPTRLQTALKSLLPFYLDRMHLIPNLEKEYIFLSKPALEKHTNCMNTLIKHKEIINTLYPSGLIQDAEFYNEYAILADVKIILETGEIKFFKLKAKLDNFTVNHETKEITLNDLKTTGKPINFFMGNLVDEIDLITQQPTGKKIWYNGSFQKYHYYRQLGMYLWLLNSYLTFKGLTYKLKANIIVIETIPSYAAKIYRINNKQIKNGINEFKKLLLLVANG